MKIRALPMPASSFVTTVSYSRTGRALTVVIGNRTYTYRVSRYLRDKLVAAAATIGTGRAYNMLVKGRTRLA